MKAKRNPCKGEHDWFPNYLAPWMCMGAELCRGQESHCRKCRWYVSECGCGCCNGAGKASHRYYQTIARKHEARWRGPLAA